LGESTPAWRIEELALERILQKHRRWEFIKQLVAFGKSSQTAQRAAKRFFVGARHHLPCITAVAINGPQNKRRKVRNEGYPVIDKLSGGKIKILFENFA